MSSLAAQVRGIAVGQVWESLDERRGGARSTVVAIRDGRVELATVARGRRVPTTSSCTAGHLLRRYVLISA